MRTILFASVLLVSTTTVSFSQTRKPAAAPKHQVIEATRQVVKMRTGGHAMTLYRFVIDWKDATAPSGEVFFKNGKEWKETKIARPERRSFGSGGPNDYMMVETSIKPEDIKAGNRIVINTTRHDHDEEPMPEAVKKMANQGIYYPVGSGKATTWKLIPVTIKTLPERLQ